ncbi:MAG TPA: hypothetical protein VFQ80_00530 [Thermomicrobiales bacterium]|nr:hypothetical protein [Thermomicrobiales bacterium]
MRRRSVLSMGMMALALPAISGRAAPARAQAATPDAVAPPQDLLPPQPPDQPGQTASINGIDIYYEVYGEGDPLLLLHGGLGNGDYFVNQIPAFDKDHQSSSWTAAATAARRSTTSRFHTN